LAEAEKQVKEAKAKQDELLKNAKKAQEDFENAQKEFNEVEKERKKASDTLDDTVKTL
jgi:uncharacterized coiled-coil DUF342 family protein